MTGVALGLDTLLDPVSVDDFLGDYWQKRPLTPCRVGTNRFTDLVSVDHVETLATIGLSLTNGTSSVLAARCLDGEAEYWDLPRGVAPSVAVHSLLHAFDAGYAIVVNGVDRFWAPINALARHIESVVQHPVGANLYYSPASVQAFPAHFDKHDVLVAQVAGRKSWQLFPPQPDAMRPDPDPWQVHPLDQPTATAVLDPGRVLYLPRGWTHRVRSHQAPSLHITFTIRTLRWADLVQRAAEHAIANDVSLHETVPLHGDADIAAINAEVADRLVALRASSGHDPHAALLSDVLMSRPPSLAGQMASFPAAHELAVDQVLRRRDGLRPLVTASATAAGDEVTIRFAGNGVTAPARFQPALELIARSETCTVRELSSAAGNDCASLARSLIVNGLLVFDTAIGLRRYGSIG